MGSGAAQRLHGSLVRRGLKHHKFLTLLATPIVITWCYVLKNFRNRTMAMVEYGGAVAQTLFVSKSKHPHPGRISVMRSYVAYYRSGS